MSGLKEKTLTQRPTSQSLSERAAAIAAAWADARLAYPLYFHLSAQFKLDLPPIPQSELPAACPASELFDKVMRWLAEMDTRIRTNQLRQLLHSMKLIRGENLAAVILRLLRRPEKTSSDRDNIDLLLATYFALCAPEDLYSCEINLADVAQVLRGVLPDADPTELEWCGPLDQILEATQQCRGLREVFNAKLLEKGRELKDASGFMFYDPAALVAFTRFNFLLRRSFFRLLHADLRAIREGLTELERRGIAAVDCRSAGLSPQETVANLREIALSWRQPIPKDYAEESANRTFEQLLAIRAAVERTLGIVPAPPAIPTIDTNLSLHREKAVPVAPSSEPRPSVFKAKPAAPATADPTIPVVKPAAPAPAVPKSISPKPIGPAKPPASKAPAPAAVPPAPPRLPEVAAAANLPKAASAPPTPPVAQRPGAPSASHISTPPTAPEKPAAENSAAPGNVPSPELEQCLENIWEQLIEAPPTRGRSMSTITLGDARVLLSAWEVNAFVSDGGQLSDDLRRAVAARAFIAVTREEHKRSGAAPKLNAAIALGRQEMVYLQERVDQAQRAKNTEAAVNLGISARRLLSAIEEAQQG